MLNEMYHEDEWPRVYTDGYKINGAGVRVEVHSRLFTQ